MTTTYNKQVLLKRGNTAVSSTYIGPVGEVTVDTDLDTIRVHDGVTPGGRLATSGYSGITPPSSPRENMLWYDTAGGRLYVYYDGAWVDASPAGDLVLAANVARLAANVANVETHITSLDANIGSFNNLVSANIGTFEIATNNRIRALDANIGTFETTVSGTVNTINSNINALNATIAGFEAQPGPTSDAWVDDAPPDISNVGALWYDAESGRLYVHYSNAWVDASPQAFGNVDVKRYLETAPADNVRKIQGYYGNIDLGATAAMYSYGASSRSYFGHIGDTSITQVIAQAEALTLSVTDNKNWLFDQAGYFTMPGGTNFIDHPTEFDSTSQVIEDIEPQYVNQVVTELAYVGFQGCVSINSLGGVGSAAVNDFGNYAVLTGTTGTGITLDRPLLVTDPLTFYSSDYTITSIGDLQITAHDLAWTFRADGATLFPGGVTLTTPVGLNPAMLVIAGQNDFKIRTGTGGNYTWNFGADGNLTVPGAITMPDATGLYSPGHNLYITAGNTTGCSVPGGDTIISSGLGYSGVAHSGGNVTLRTGDYYNKIWNFDYNGNLTLPADGDIRDSVSNISVLKNKIGDTYAPGAFQQLTIAHDEGRLITIAGGTSLFRLPQLTADLLGAEFEFYFSADAGQVYIQAFYTGTRGTTDKFVGSLFVGVDNSTQGRLHTATAGVADANYLFLGQHHGKAGSYIKFKAIAFDTVGTWLVQGQCVGDTVNTTPNGQSYMFQNYYD